MTAKIMRATYLILVVLAMSIALLTGCEPIAEEEPGLGEETGLTDETGPTEEPELTDETGSSVSESQKEVAEVTGFVKETDSAAGTVTIVSEDGSEIELNVPAEEVLDMLSAMADETDIPITVGYDNKTRTVINVYKADTQNQAASSETP